FESAGFLVFEDANRAVRAISAVAKFAASFAAADGAKMASPAPTGPALVASDLQGLDERDAKTLLARAGIPVLAEVLAADADEAGAAAATMQMPVALKIVSPDIQHKTEIGGVVLGLASPEAVSQETASMLERVRR